MSGERSGGIAIDYASLRPDERDALGTQPAADSGSGLALRRDGDRLLLVAREHARPFLLDFATPQWRARLRGPTPPLVRAIGARTRIVVDATAGFGRDAFALAARGLVVHAIERDAVTRLLFADALARARQDPELAPIAGRITLHGGDARARLGELVAATGADAVYLDPMFADPGSAGVRREAQLLRRLAAPDEDAAGLFAAARASGARRIVVKRQRRQPPLAPEPSGATRGTRVRFDWYLAPA
jgi:16S rRNA (guanine1516-N2)-methyltransferase